jgi:hypothetical protein
VKPDTHHPDMAAAIDSPLDEVCERFGCSREKGAQILEWHRDIVDREAIELAEWLQVEAMTKLLSLIYEPGRNLGAWVWALAFAADLPMRGVVKGGMAELAAKLKVSRALLSAFAKRWRDELPMLALITTFQRSPETKERCRVARKRVLEANRKL